MENNYKERFDHYHKELKKLRREILTNIAEKVEKNNGRIEIEPFKLQTWTFGACVAIEWKDDVQIGSRSYGKYDNSWMLKEQPWRKNVRLELIYPNKPERTEKWIVCSTMVLKVEPYKPYLTDVVKEEVYWFTTSFRTEELIEVFNHIKG